MSADWINVRPEEFRKSFSSQQQLMALFHVQGDVSPGHAKIGDAVYRELLEDPDIPNYSNKLAHSLDTGGQTAHVFEKLSHMPKYNVPSVMFSLSRDAGSTRPRVERHSENSYVVFLPQTVFEEAGIPKSLIVQDPIGDRGIVSKETLIAHPAVFERIAEHSLRFLEGEIPDFNKKVVLSTGHFIDGGHCVLQLNAKLKQSEKFAGKAISLFNPHGLAINKLQTLLKKELEKVDRALDEFPIKGNEFKQVRDHPILSDQHKILDAINSGQKPEAVAAMIGVFIDRYDTLLKDFIGLYEALVAAHLEAGSKRGVATTPFASSQEIERVIHSTLFSMERTVGFRNHLALEGSDQLANFDGIAVTSEAMKKQICGWIGDQLPVAFIRNGVGRTIYNPDIIAPHQQSTVLQESTKLLNKAWQTNGPSSATIAPEDLKDATLFIAVSQPSTRKGAPVAIKAFVQYLNAHPESNAFLVLGGHKPKSEQQAPQFLKYLQQQVREADSLYPSLKISKRIRFLPPLKSYESRLLYALPRAIGLSPSENEPWGIVGVEQLASGIPVIGSDHYASLVHFKARGGESITLFPSTASTSVSFEESANGLANAMEQVSQDYSRLKECAQSFAHKVVQESDWRHMAEAYNEFLQALRMRGESVSAENPHTRVTASRARVGPVREASPVQPEIRHS